MYNSFKQIKNLEEKCRIRKKQDEKSIDKKYMLWYNFSIIDFFGKSNQKRSKEK